VSRCSAIAITGMRCRNNAYEVHDGKCFVHAERERKEKRNLPPTLPPLRLFGEITDVPRKRLKEVDLVTREHRYEEDCTAGSPCLECERCIAAMDWDDGFRAVDL
jgi:hypothetical protein